MKKKGQMRIAKRKVENESEKKYGKKNKKIDERKKE